MNGTVKILGASIQGRRWVMEIELVQNGVKKIFELKDPSRVNTKRPIKTQDGWRKLLRELKVGYPEHPESFGLLVHKARFAPGDAIILLFNGTRLIEGEVYPTEILTEI